MNREPVRTVSSAPGSCQVCASRRRMQVVAITNWRVTAYMPCPHCSIEEVLEIRHYPIRNDIPKDAA